MLKMSELFKDKENGKFSTTTIDVFKKLEKRADKAGVSWVEQLRNESPEMADILSRMIEAELKTAGNLKNA